MNGQGHPEKEFFVRCLVRWLDEQASHYRRQSKLASRKRSIADAHLRAEIYEHLKTMVEQDRLPFVNPKEGE